AYDPYCKDRREVFVSAGLVELMAATAVMSPSGHSSACVAAHLVAYGFNRQGVGATASATSVQIGSVSDLGACAGILSHASSEQTSRELASSPPTRVVFTCRGAFAKPNRGLMYYDAKLRFLL